MYGYKCEYCQGTVQPRVVKRILHLVHAVATGAKAPEKIEPIPVTHPESA